jgi:hypothetical protein
VAQVKSARSEMDSDARQAALLAERMASVAKQSIEEDLTTRHVAAMQRVMAEAAKGLATAEGGEVAGKSADAQERGGSAGRSSGPGER